MVEGCRVRRFTLNSFDFQTTLPTLPTLINPEMPLVFTIWSQSQYGHKPRRASPWKLLSFALVDAYDGVLLQTYGQHRACAPDPGDSRGRSRTGKPTTALLSPLWLVARSHGHSTQIRRESKKCSRATTRTWGLGRRGRRLVVDAGIGRGERGREGRGGLGRGRRAGLGQSFQVGDD